MKYSVILVFLLIAVARCVDAHIEDICVEPGGKYFNNKHDHGKDHGKDRKELEYNGASWMTRLAGYVQPFYKLGQSLECEYNDWSPKCLVASLVPQLLYGFNDTSSCRGFVHFYAIYYVAVSQGFKKEYAYFLAAYSQAIDFVQYRAVDSCGESMDLKWWTPPMRGFLRTNTKLGGTQRHLGIPFVGNFSGPYLRESKKQYKGNKEGECKRYHFKRQYEYYRDHCPGLEPNTTDMFYEGALSSGRRWAFMETDLLCIGGYTSIGDDGSPFTGHTCPKSGKVTSVNIGKLVSGPVPLAGGDMMLGEQYINYNCEPACACDGTCKTQEMNDNYQMVDVVKVNQLPEYLANNSQYSRIDDQPVPEEIVRFGIYLHWVADRASHWYCCDAPASGMSIGNITDSENYNLNMYMSETACNFVGHSYVHMMEQGMKTVLAPGSYSALQGTFTETVAFKEAMLKNGHQDWFDKERADNPYDFETIIGTAKKPGELFRLTLLQKADERVQGFMDSLKRLNLPALPGFETECKKQTRGSLRNSVFEMFQTDESEN